MASRISPRRLRKSNSPSHIRHETGRREVAAVCYRAGERGLEFLLVQTRGARWIFPKGGVEPGLSSAQSAALEAFEEAGVHGRMEEIPFASYSRYKADDTLHKKTPSKIRHRPVATHLCEVSYLEPPQESDRKPTWFSPEKAKQRLRADRATKFGDELAAVVDRAVSRIRRLQSGRLQKEKIDVLRHARCDGFHHSHLPGRFNNAARMRSFFLEQGLRPEAAAELGKRPIRKLLQLGTGTRSPSESVQNITPIDVAPETKPGSGKGRSFPRI